jgi:uncharacterized membrane protein
MSTQNLFWRNFLNWNFSLSVQWLYIFLLTGWVTNMLALPFIHRAWGDAGLTGGVVAGVLLQAVAVLLALWQAWGFRRTAWIAAVALTCAWAVEAVGVSTGFPFGAYVYTNRLYPQLAGVPLLIPLAWLMMLPPAWAVAQRLSGRRRGLVFVLVSAVAFTAWDLFLDPQMVAWGLWVWAEPGGYFGIPWSNYAGWLLASALITLAARPPKLTEPPLLLVYSITWVMETVGLMLFWGLTGPALAGFVGMGSLAVWSMWRGKK